MTSRRPITIGKSSTSFANTQTSTPTRNLRASSTSLSTSSILQPPHDRYLVTFSEGALPTPTTFLAQNPGKDPQIASSGSSASARTRSNSIKTGGANRLACRRSLVLSERCSHDCLGFPLASICAVAAASFSGTFFLTHQTPC